VQGRRLNVADLLRVAADAQPHRPALLFQGKEISYAVLDERVDLTAAALADLGVTKGDRVAMLAGNVPEFVEGFYATARAGGVLCPLNILLTPEETSYILADCRAKIAIVELPFLPGLLSVSDRLADLETILVIGGPPAPARTLSLEEALQQAGDPPSVVTEAADLALIAYTAGTTAAPKGAMLTHGNLLANLEQVASVPAFDVGPGDVILLALPLFHIYALNVVLGVTIRSRATGILAERFDPGESLRLIRRHGVTVLFGAPPMYAAWLRPDPAHNLADILSSVRVAVSGAAPLPAAVLEAFRDDLGLVIWEGYGLTESGPAVTTNAVGGTPKPGSIGVPLRGVEVRLVDERGRDVEEGDPGEIWVRGPNVFAGYWGRPHATSEVLQGDWLRTGDVAVQDDEGYLFLVDRKTDLINVSGFSVFPKEVEEAISRHPRIREAAVVGVPDERTGEAVQAWVVPREGEAVTAEEILDFLRGYVARFKLPREIRVVGELPHHVTGKVLRRMLRDEEP
jgi:long-chain acyl-CoA synthetase